MQRATKVGQERRCFSVACPACASSRGLFSANHSRADSLDSCQIRRLEAGLRASVQKIFFTSCLVCLTHRCGRFGDRTRVTRPARSLQSRKKSNTPKSYILWAFSSARKNLRTRRCAIVLCNMSRVLRVLLRSHDMLPAQARTCLMLQKHWFFYHAVVIPMQCSRSPRARTTSPLTHG